MHTHKTCTHAFILQALTPSQISEALELTQIKDRNWQIIPSNALSGAGLAAGMKWLSHELDEK